MREVFISLMLLTTGLATAFEARSQTMPTDELIMLTSVWAGERYADGRPKIPDSLLRRAAVIGIDDAWTVLRNEGYRNQFASGLKMVDPTIRVVGRAFTAMFLPNRPDLEHEIKRRGELAGRKGSTNSWPIELLNGGDVYVADGFGKIAGGTLIGSTLGNAIFSKTGTGVVFDGGARDLEGLAEIQGFNAFVRDFHPSYLEDMVLAGINTPIRIGEAIVFPGDLVLADRTGVLFIPAHLAERTVYTAEFVALKDQFNFDMLKSGKYETGQLDEQWGEMIKFDFLAWLEERPTMGRMTKRELDFVMEKRTW